MVSQPWNVANVGGRDRAEAGTLVNRGRKGGGGTGSGRGKTRRGKGGRLGAVSLFSWSVEQIARDTQMTTRVTEGPRRERLFFLLVGLPPSFLASRVSRPHVLPLLNLKKKRDCSRSRKVGAL